MVSRRCSPLRTIMSQMAIVSFTAVCFWSISSPSRMWYWSGASWSSLIVCVICSRSQSGAWYVLNRSACLFHSSILPVGRCLIMVREPLYFSCAAHPRFWKYSDSSLGMLVFGRGG